MDKVDKYIFQKNNKELIVDTNVDKKSPLKEKRAPIRAPIKIRIALPTLRKGIRALDEMYHFLFECFGPSRDLEK